MTKAQKALIKLLESGDTHTTRSAAQATGYSYAAMHIALEFLVLTDSVKYISHKEFMLNPRLLIKKRRKPGTFPAPHKVV